jgi:uncharacterized membrane protein YqjE
MSLKNEIMDYLKINDLRENIVKLIEAKFELTKIEIQEKAEGLISQLIHSMLTLFLAFMLFLFISILLAVGINQWLGSSYWGFVIITGLYLILLLIWIFSKSFIQKTIQKTVEKVIDEKMNKGDN